MKKRKKHQNKKDETMTVIGPIDQQTFRYMNLLKGSLKHLQSQDDPIYKETIRKERALLKEELQSVVGKEIS